MRLNMWAGLALLIVSFITPQAYASPEHKPLVYFVHGLGSEPDVWHGFPEELEQQFPDLIETRNFRYRTAKYNFFCFSSWLPGCERVPTTEEIASKLLTDVEDTLSTSRRPVIFIAHSYGGIVVADAMRQAKERSISCLDCIAGVAFIASPFRPNPVARLRKMLPNSTRQVKDLSGDAIDRIVGSWRSAARRDLPVVCIWGTSDDIVEEAAAHEPCSDAKARPEAKRKTVDGGHNSLIKKEQNAGVRPAFAHVVNLVRRSITYTEKRTWTCVSEDPVPVTDKCVGDHWVFQQSDGLSTFRVWQGELVPEVTRDTSTLYTFKGQSVHSATPAPDNLDHLWWQISVSSSGKAVFTRIPAGPADPSAVKPPMQTSENGQVNSDCSRISGTYQTHGKGSQPYLMCKLPRAIEKKDQGSLRKSVCK